MNVDGESHRPTEGAFDRPTPERDLVELIGSARGGDQAAWNELVRRYAPLVSAVTRQFRLSPADTEDVSQVVWLRLVENLAALREAQALPGWIRTTTRNEALRILAARRRTEATSPSALVMLEHGGHDEGVDHELLRAEQARVISDGLAELAPEHRRLLVLLCAEPPASYQEISETLHMPQGSIGPTRARCLEKLRRTRALRAFVAAADDSRDLSVA